MQQLPPVPLKQPESSSILCSLRSLEVLRLSGLLQLRLRILSPLSRRRRPGRTISV